MGKSPRMFALTAAIALCISVATVALCGGPPQPARGTSSTETARADTGAAGPEQRGDQQPNQPNTPPPSSGGGSGAGEGFSLTAGAGPASVNGQIGASPAMTLSSLNIKQNWGVNGRASYALPLSSAGLGGRVTADYYRFRFAADQIFDDSESQWGVGSVSPFTGIAMGDSLHTNLQINMTILSADLTFGMGNMAGIADCQLGPRVEYFIYDDYFTIENNGGSGFTVTGEQFWRSRKKSVVGVGFVGSLGLSSLVSALAGGAGSSGVYPKVRFSAAAGKNDGMKYASWEASLVLLMRGASFYEGYYGPAAANVPGPGIALEAAYVFKRITEVLDEPSFPGVTTAFGDPHRSADENYDLRYPVIRASLTF